MSIISLFYVELAVLNRQINMQRNKQLKISITPRLRSLCASLIAARSILSFAHTTVAAAARLIKHTSSNCNKEIGDETRFVKVNDVDDERRTSESNEKTA